MLPGHDRSKTVQSAVTSPRGHVRGRARARARALCRVTVHDIRPSPVCAFAYNGRGAPIVARVHDPRFGLQLGPMLAAPAMSFASVPVIGDALRLRSTWPGLG